ncbi:hypothetical protein AMTRI_Chr02g217360 [Amborella trichopoda]
MAPRKGEAISKGKGKVSERADNRGEEEASPLFPRVRSFPEVLPSHISQGPRSGKVPRRVNDFLIIGPWFRDWFLSAQQWPELLAFLTSVSMIGILNMASCHVNFLLLEALDERFNYQTNTFFLSTRETTPTLEEIARVFGLSLVGIAYQPSTATDNHSIMGARLLGAAYSSHGQWVNMELLVRNRERSRATEQIHIFLVVLLGSVLFLSGRKEVRSSLVPLAHAFWERAGYTIQPC